MTYANLVTERPPVAISRPARSRKVPDYLVKEEIDGIKFYYRGWRQVLKKTKQKEEIRGCSGLQSLMIEYLLDVLFEAKIRKTHRIFTNETGNHLAFKNNLQFDLAIYEKAVLTPDKITRRYVQGIAPAVVIEVDMDVDLEDTGLASMEDFVLLKTGKLLEYGTRRVIWIFSRSRKVLVAAGPSWSIDGWEKDIEILDGITFNLARFFEEEGINPDAA